MAEEGTGIEDSPTYSVAITAFIFILLSLLAERAIHRLKKYLKRKNQKPLRKVLDKMTEELMLLGFISLLLTVLQNAVTKLCVSEGFSKHMLPCSDSSYASLAFAPEASFVSSPDRKLLSYASMETLRVGSERQLLAETTETGHCEAKGKVPFVSLEVLHQLHLFIFVLAVTHVFYSLLTVCLGFARIHNWQKWERETRCEGYDGQQDLNNRMCKALRSKQYPSGQHAHVFVDRHAKHKCYQNPISIWILCFFQQFFSSVSREDYLVFRVGFLNKHNLGESFNFRDYVIRSMEVDFKKVIGVSWWLWLVVILFLLLNVHGWYTYFWVAFVPAIIVLVMGTKQQHIISTLALQAQAHAAKSMDAQKDLEKLGSEAPKVADMAKAVTPSDNLFWFDNPRIFLRLLHFVIFQNSFELAVFFWLVTAFGWNSCILGNHTLLIVRLITGLFTQFLASYSTLPIYALVAQMGTQMKETVFTKEVFEGLQGWRAKAQRRRMRESLTGSSTDNSPSNKSEPFEGAETSVEGKSSHHGSGSVLQSLAREGKSGHCDSDNISLMCRRLYGKEWSDKIKAAQVNPS